MNENEKYEQEPVAEQLEETTMNENNTYEEPAQESELQPKQSKKAKKGDKEPKSIGREIIEWIVTIAVAVAVALVIRTFIFEPVRVDGHSMDETLADGEVMFVTKFDYLTPDAPERFDIVICHYPGRDNTNFVKRIVGLPGDKVAVEGGYLYVNGEKYEEEYLVHRPNYRMMEYTVPEGQYFVLGDNRSNSNDSHVIGPITRDMIIGHVRAVFFPFNKARGVD